MTPQELGACGPPLHREQGCSLHVTPAACLSQAQGAVGGNMATRLSTGILWGPCLPYWTWCWESREDACWETPQYGKRSWSQEKWGSNPSSTHQQQGTSDLTAPHPTGETQCHVRISSQAPRQTADPMTGCSVASSEDWC